MPVFTYTGRARGGEYSSGMMEGDSRDSIATRLFSSGITPIEIKLSVPRGENDMDAVLRRMGFGKPKISDLVLFSRQMYTITKAGLPLLRGLKGLAASTNNKVLQATLEDVLKDLEGGRDLASSFARHPKIFPTLYVS